MKKVVIWYYGHCISYIILLFSMTVYIKIKDAILPAHHEHIKTVIV